MSASQGPRSRAGVPERVASRPATADRFATAVPPQPPGDPNPHFDRESTEVMPLRINRESDVDGGAASPAARAPAADGGADSAATSSLLAAMALHRFDDDVRWRKLARTGRAL